MFVSNAHSHSILSPCHLAELLFVISAASQKQTNESEFWCRCRFTLVSGTQMRVCLQRCKLTELPQPSLAVSYVPGIVLSSTIDIVGAPWHRPESLKQHCNADLHPLTAVAGSCQVGKYAFRCTSLQLCSNHLYDLATGWEGSGDWDLEWTTY